MGERVNINNVKGVKIMTEMFGHSNIIATIIYNYSNLKLFSRMKLFTKQFIWTRAVMTLLLMVSATTAWAQFMWLGSEGVWSIDTGLDNGSCTSGYWFPYTDNTESGNSEVVWDVAPDEYGTLNELVETCGGISATAQLGHLQGVPPKNPFVGVGFLVAGEDQYCNPAPADASAWEGIAIAYTCEVDATLELGLGDFDAEIYYANPYVTLPKSVNGTLKKFRWSEFKQPNWYTGTKKISGEEAAMQLAAVNFKVQAAPGNYHFNIYGIGSYDAPLPPSPSKPYIPNAIDEVDSGQLTVDSWYTITGIQLEGEPTAPGVYVKDGRKVMVK